MKLALFLILLSPFFRRYAFSADRPNVLFIIVDDMNDWVSPPHTPSPLHVQRQLDPAPSKAIS